MCAGCVHHTSTSQQHPAAHHHLCPHTINLSHSGNLPHPSTPVFTSTSHQRGGSTHLVAAEGVEQAGEATSASREGGAHSGTSSNLTCSRGRRRQRSGTSDREVQPRMHTLAVPHVDHSRPSCWNLSRLKPDDIAVWLNGTCPRVNHVSQGGRMTAHQRSCCR
jgi:hypothetical protein